MVTLPASMPPQPPMYNNWGYFLLGHVLMARTGKPTLTAALYQLLLKPLSSHRRPLRAYAHRGPGTRRGALPPDGLRRRPERRRSRPAAAGLRLRRLLEPRAGRRGRRALGLGRRRRARARDARRQDCEPRTEARCDQEALHARRRRRRPRLRLRARRQRDGGRVLRDEGRLAAGEQPELRALPDRRLLDGRLLEPQRHRRGTGGDAWWYPDFPAVLTIARSARWSATDLFPKFGMPTLVPRRRPAPSPRKPR